MVENLLGVSKMGRQLFDCAIKENLGGETQLNTVGVMGRILD